MSTLEKNECMENLKCLGILDALSCPSSTRRQDTNEFSFDVPNYAAFPTILHELFCRIDADQSHQRFKDCWPVCTRADRVKFRQLSLCWLQQIKKVELRGTMPEYSSLFESPFGDRYVKFLLRMSTYALRKQCERGGLTSENADTESRASSVSSTGSTRESDGGGSLLDLQMKAVSDYTDHASSVIKDFMDDLENEEELMRQQWDIVHTRFVRLSPILKYPSETIEEAPQEEHLRRFVELISWKGKEKLQKCQETWNNLGTLFDCGKEFERIFQLAVGDKVVLKGIKPSDIANASEVLQRVFAHDGRLDVFELIRATKSTVTDFQRRFYEIEKSRDFSSLRKSISAPTLLLQEQRFLRDKLERLKEELLHTTRRLRLGNAQTAPVPSPSWLHVPPPIRLKPWPDLDWPSLQCSVDWPKLSSITSNTLEENDTVDHTDTAVFNTLSRKCSGRPSKPSIETSGPTCSSVSAPQVVDKHLLSSNNIPATSGALPSDDSLSKPPSTAARRFRLSLSPSLPLSSQRRLSVNMAETSFRRQLDENWSSSTDTRTDQTLCTPGIDRSLNDSLQYHRRFSIRLQGDLLKILEADDEGR